MVTGLWGKKVGMTQLFADGKVVPATVIDLADWVVTQIKTASKDGYEAVQLGHIRKPYSDKTFSIDWLKQPQKYFSAMREVRLKDGVNSMVVGTKPTCDVFVTIGDCVDISGVTKGCGFAGVVRRHNFTGARASHGTTMGKRPGALSFMRAKGKVIKGKRLPGHMGVVKRTMKNLEVVRIEQAENLLIVRGSVPGKAGSMVFVRKA